MFILITIIAVCFVINNKDKPAITIAVPVAISLVTFGDDEQKPSFYNNKRGGNITECDEYAYRKQTLRPGAAPTI